MGLCAEDAVEMGDIIMEQPSTSNRLLITQHIVLEQADQAFCALLSAVLPVEFLQDVDEDLSVEAQLVHLPIVLVDLL